MLYSYNVSSDKQLRMNDNAVYSERAEAFNSSSQIDSAMNGIDVSGLSVKNPSLFTYMLHSEESFASCKNNCQLRSTNLHQKNDGLQ